MSRPGIVRSAGGNDPICKTQFDVDSKAKEQNYLESAADLKGLYIHEKARSVVWKAWSLWSSDQSTSSRLRANEAMCPGATKAWSV